MKKHTRFLTLLLALTLLTALTSCWLLEEPFGGTEEASREDTRPYDDIPIGDVYTDSETCIFPDIPADGTIPAEISPRETSPRETSPLETSPAESDIRTLIGTVVEYDGENPEEHVWAVETWMDGGRTTLYVYYDDPDMTPCVGDEIEFTYDAGAGVLELEHPDGISVLKALTMEYAPMAAPEKPVLYLYPETPTRVSVKLTIDGELTCTYPAYEKGWDNLTAHPDGTLVFPDGKEYYCLYWEGKQNMNCDFSEGFCVKGTDTATFLEWALTELGLTPREANEFIIYWLPRMEDNPYNVISFQTDAYTEGAVLEITPGHDSLLRVFMAWYPSDEAVEMQPQTFTPFERTGFVAVEWGGCELSEAK